MRVRCRTLGSAFSSEESQGTQWSNEAAWPQRGHNMELQGDDQVPQKGEVAVKVKAMAGCVESQKWGGLETAFSFHTCSYTIFTPCHEGQICQEWAAGYKTLIS